MNRRSFIHSLLAGSVAPIFLRGAGRLWRPVHTELLANPEWINASYELHWMGFPVGGGLGGGSWGMVTLPYPLSAGETVRPFTPNDPFAWASRLNGDIPFRFRSPEISMFDEDLPAKAIPPFLTRTVSRS